jgi:hypothetical protein
MYTDLRRAMIQVVTQGRYNLCESKVVAIAKPQPKQYADGRGDRSQLKSVSLPYQVSGIDQWIRSSGGRTDV